jgi:hypothetical protein
MMLILLQEGKIPSQDTLTDILATCSPKVEPVIEYLFSNDGVYFDPIILPEFLRHFDIERDQYGNLSEEFYESFILDNFNRLIPREYKGAIGIYFCTQARRLIDYWTSRGIDWETGLEPNTANMLKATFVGKATQPESSKKTKNALSKKDQRRQRQPY